MNKKCALFSIFFLSLNTNISAADIEVPHTKSRTEEEISPRDSDCSRASDLSDGDTVTDFFNEAEFLRACAEYPEDILDNACKQACKKTVQLYLTKSYETLTKFAPDWMKNSPLWHAIYAFEHLIGNNILPNNKRTTTMIWELRKRVTGEYFIKLIEDTLKSFDTPYKEEVLFPIQTFIDHIKKIRDELHNATDTQPFKTFSNKDRDNFYNHQSYCDREVINEALFAVYYIRTEFFRKVKKGAVWAALPERWGFSLNYIRRLNQVIDINNIYNDIVNAHTSNNIGLYIILKEIVATNKITYESIYENKAAYTKAFQSLIKKYFENSHRYGNLDKEQLKQYFNHIIATLPEMSKIDQAEQDAPRTAILLDLIESACKAPLR